MKHFLHFGVLLFCCGASLWGQTPWKVDAKQSEITYKGEHTLHAWEGKNSNVLGLAIPNSTGEGLEKLAILAYVKDFDSNNSGRDAHALEVLEALRYPEIKFYSENIPTEGNELSVEGTFDFHGKKITKAILCKKTETTDFYQLEGAFSLSLTDFDIPLPSFMMVKMDDLIEISFQIVLTKE